jgi:FkbH-like protein
MKINWSPKVQSIAELAQDLDIGMDSIVFIDDNPVEREAVRIALPEVTVPEFPADTCELASFCERVYKDYFFTLESTEEDRKRTEAYRANAKRAAERTAAPSIEGFLAGLRTQIYLARARDEDLPRAAQLTQKTNQFNLTTRRYTEQELRALQTTSDTAVFIASVADKYGDNGKVFVSIVQRETLNTAKLDTFLMSCRVVGRFIEDQILDQMVQDLRADGFSRLRVQFIPTRKNALARTFIERLRGGRLVSDDDSGAQTWEFDIANISPVTKTGYAELVTQPARFSKVLA